MAVTAADVSKLRKSTGAGMMDCKKALEESNGDIEKAVEIIRKKGMAIANKRADRDATEGAVLSKTLGNKGGIVVLNCETDFVAKNESFVALAQQILDVALEGNAGNAEDVKALEIDGKKVSDIITEQTGVIGEKLDVSYFEKIESEYVVSYIHPGNKLATLVAFNKAISDEQVGKDVAMQIAAMAPVSINKESVPQEVIDKELEIGKEQARQEGKPEAMLEKIAAGKLNKFFKENTLLSQAFIKDNKTSVEQYLQAADKDLTVVDFKRFSLNA